MDLIDRLLNLGSFSSIRSEFPVHLVRFAMNEPVDLKVTFLKSEADSLFRGTLTGHEWDRGVSNLFTNRVWI